MNDSLPSRQPGWRDGVIERLSGVPRRIGRSWRDLRTQPTRNTQNGSTALSTGCGAPASEPDVALRPECSSDGVFGAFGGRSRTETDGEVAGEGRLTKRLGTFNQLSTTGRCARYGHRRVALETKGVARLASCADNRPAAASMVRISVPLEERSVMSSKWKAFGLTLRRPATYRYTVRNQAISVSSHGCSTVSPSA
jgi:hypothetical protein